MSLSTFEQFLAHREQHGPYTEFYDGELIVIDEYSPEHIRVANELTGMLQPQLLESAWEIYANPLVRIKDAHFDIAYSADIVLAGKMPNPPYIEYPLLIIDLFTRYSAHKNVGCRRYDYYLVPSLRHYIEVNIDQRWVMTHDRIAPNQWLLTEPRAAAQVIELMGMAMDFSRIFQGLLMKSDI
ncbi:MAG: hypothetical protein U1F55_03275 [Chitinivorax sp.]